MVWWEFPELLPAIIRDVPFSRVTEEPAPPQRMDAVPFPTWTDPSCTTMWPELLPVSFNKPVPVFRTVPSPMMALPKTMSDGVARVMKELASGERENTGLVTVPKSTVTVAPLAAPKKEPVFQVTPVPGRAVS